jgi:hypothetical protein
MTETPVVSKTAGKTAQAATSFLDTLKPEQRRRATFDFTSEERQNWHYVPRPRKGLARGDMDGAQLEAADALMASSLSLVGLDKSRAIIQHELILGGIERGTGVTRFDRTPDLYFLSVFGAPGGDEPWGWSVEGHHLSLNITVVNGDLVSATPSFFGANPAQVKHGPDKGLRILQLEEELARELYRSLEPRQSEMAVIYPVAPSDLITRASRRVEVSQRAGLPAQLMSADQREMLMSLLKVYIDRVPADVARNALKRVEDDGVDEIFFAWAGSQHQGQGHYYRVHGPSFFVEYDNTQDMANHIHSVWRDIDDDFGADLLRVHYLRHHA